MKYLVAHNRDRDSYEVSAAFAEVQQLGGLVTDYYDGCAWLPVRSLKHRRHAAIDPDLVVVSAQAFSLQVAGQLGSLILRRRVFPATAIERVLGSRVKRVCGDRRDLALVIYSGCALEAFKSMPHNRKTLVVFHPMPQLVRDILSKDKQEFPRLEFEPEPEMHSAEHGVQRREAEIQLADDIICASSLSKRSIMAYRDDGLPVSVIPYGCPQVADDLTETYARERRALFVGQGVQRKGLHHLLEAWRKVRLKGWTLRLICSRLDHAIQQMVGSDESIELSGSIPRGDLVDEMRRADTMVLPSLVEGFGLVITEALAQGCRVIASDATGLADLPLVPGVGWVHAAGDITELSLKLKMMDESFDPCGSYRHEVIKVAKENSWSQFRQGVRGHMATEERQSSF